MIARSTRLDAARAREIGGERAADRPAPARRPEQRAVIHRLEREFLIVRRQQRLDLGERRSGLRGQHQFLGLIERDARQTRQIEAQIPLRRAADAALGAVADDLQRLGLGQRPLDGGFDVLRVARFEEVDHQSKPRNVRKRHAPGMHVHAAELGAAMQGRKHFPGIEQALRVEGAFERAAAD